ncbi:Hsp20/alpha crystallin family protein [Methylomarinum sp. Ch1-1]|uniref:Hsp20/alpha crystallin family protein n=1 Tax=Methylomarinum roseum TaxID=3067653 RepID=A0AAU7NWK5_9GAMM|nr:Hsp20/alpha crystallin family protein [Methylomarinum sp. Ch1-1]MDP4522609.1 Hsp20/alpha crystallin family protein [Methylomarinum sp. Ch1-1]
MNLKKLNPWNWFKHEESPTAQPDTIPVRREQYDKQLGAQHPMARFHREIDRLFDEAFRGFRFPALSRDVFPETGFQWQRLPTFNPELNISSDDKEYTITLEAAGLEEKDLNIKLNGRRLSIEGNKQEASEDQDKSFYRIERRYGAFQRVLSLPDDADADHIKASMKNGLLTMRIPREQQPNSDTRTINIEKS